MADSKDNNQFGTTFEVGPGDRILRDIIDMTISLCSEDLMNNFR